MLSCEEFTSRITDYLDGRVPYGEKIGIWMHKMMCVRCRNYLRQMQELVVFVGTHNEPPDMPIDSDQRTRLVELFNRRHGSDDGDEKSES